MNWLKRMLGASRAPAADATGTPQVTDRVELNGESLSLANGAHWHEELPHPDFLQGSRSGAGSRRCNAPFEAENEAEAISQC